MAVTSSEKLIKAACKPKKGGIKPKYLDPIIASTQVPDGPISDLCAALAPRIREPNVDVVFKALLVLHNMIRSGGTDNVLEYLSRMDVLRLKSVGTGGFWEGYQHAETLTHYAHYLHARITAYRELKHDMVRVQAENNRASAYRTHTEGASERARKLRSLTVEKGLLRETRQVQKIIDALVKAQFFRDDLQDECTVLAFRMMVKDLLVLFQAGNEGIINLLEHYFEMEHKQAADALSLYKNFCQQTKKVVEYLKYAKELNNVIDVPIPNLKHAPVSLVAALQEYLDDPNFEDNRSEYKANKDVADGKTPAAKTAAKPTPSSTAPAASSSSAPAQAPAQMTPPKKDQALVDFFSSIEENQPTMFNPQTNSPTSAYFEQQATFNPFAARMQQQQTGFQQPQQFGQQPSPFGQQKQIPMGLQPQATGFAAFGGGFPPPQQPQFGQPSQQQQQQAFLQPQPTGFNPFRQSMLMPQATGFSMQQSQQPPPMPSMPSNGMGGGPFPQQQQQQQPPQQQPTPSSPFDFLSQPPPPPQQQQPSSNGFLSSQPTGFQSNVLQPQPTGHHPSNPFGQVRSATSPPSMQPLVAQPTGSKNPFAPAGGVVPPMPTRPSEPKGPSLHELAFGGGSSAFGGQQQQNSAQQQQQQPNGSGGGNDMSSLASSFALNRPSSAGPSFAASPTGASPSSLPFSSHGSHPHPPSAQPLQPQATGYAGSAVQPFKPSSSFGASLLSSLPEVSSPSASSPGGGGGSFLQPQQTGMPNPFRQSSMPFASSGLSSQATGASSAFGGGASLFGTNSSATTAPSPGASSFSSPMQTPAFTGGASLFGGGAGQGGQGGLVPQATGLPPAFKPTSNFGMSSFGSPGAGAAGSGGGSNPFGAPQGNGQAGGGGGSLI